MPLLQLPPPLPPINELLNYPCDKSQGGRETHRWGKEAGKQTDRDAAGDSVALWRRCRLNMAPAVIQPRQEPTLLPLWLPSLSPNPSIPSPCLFPLAFSFFSFFFFFFLPAPFHPTSIPVGAASLDSGALDSFYPLKETAAGCCCGGSSAMCSWSKHHTDAPYGRLSCNAQSAAFLPVIKNTVTLARRGNGAQLVLTHYPVRAVPPTPNTVHVDMFHPQHLIPEMRSAIVSTVNQQENSLCNSCRAK